MELPLITPSDVAAFAPTAPAVSPLTIQEASDAIQALSERQRLVLPAPNTAEGRNVQRALICWALYLTLSTAAASQDITPNLVEERLGDVANKYVSPTETSALQATGAQNWLARAWAYLVQAGFTPPALVAGASA